MSQPLNFRNKEIIMRALEGQTAEMIAGVFDLEVSTVQGILNSPLVKQEMERLQAVLHQDTMEKIKQRSGEALEVVTDVMRGEVGSELRFKAARDILDRNLELKPKTDGAKEFGEGLGESIIRALARKKAEGEDARTGSERQGESSTPALGSGPAVRHARGNGQQLSLFGGVRPAGCGL